MNSKKKEAEILYNILEPDLYRMNSLLHFIISCSRI